LFRVGWKAPRIRMFPLRRTDLVRVAVVWRRFEFGVISERWSDQQAQGKSGLPASSSSPSRGNMAGWRLLAGL